MTKYYLLIRLPGQKIVNCKLSNRKSKYLFNMTKNLPCYLFHCLIVM